MFKRRTAFVVILLLALGLVACASLPTPEISTSRPCEVEPGGSHSFHLQGDYPSGTEIQWASTLGLVLPSDEAFTTLTIPSDAAPGSSFIVSVTLSHRNREAPASVECRVAGEPVATEPSVDEDDDEPPEATQPPTNGATPIPHDGATRPENDSHVWFNSHPSGASVYLVPADVEIYDLDLASALSPANLIGQTPLSVEVPPGNYYALLNFESGIFEAMGVTLPGYSDPTYDYAFPFDGNISTSTSLSGGENVETITRIYRLQKRAGNSESLIAISLPLPEEERPQSTPYIYPTLATVEMMPVQYTLNPDVMTNSIAEDVNEYSLSGVDAAMIAEMVEVLQRAGKVRLNTDTIDIMIQLNGYDGETFTVTAYQ